MQPAAAVSASSASSTSASRSSGSCHLRELLFLGAGGDRPPGRARRRRGSSARGVKAKPGADRGALAEDRQALRPGTARASRSDLRWTSGLRAGGGDHVVEDRPLGHRGQLLDEREVGLDVAGGLGDLDEALVALGAAPRPGRGCPRRTSCRSPSACRRSRPASSSRPRRWIEKPHRPASMPSCSRRCISLRSGVGGRAGLGRLEAHHVDHQRRGRHVLDDVHALGRAHRASRGTRGWSPSPRACPRAIDS